MKSIFKQKISLLHQSKTKFQNNIFENIFKFSLFITIISLALIAIYIFWNGLQLFTQVNPSKFFLSINWEPTVRKEFGILPMIISSFYITFASVLVSVPIGVACAVYAAELAGGNLKKIIQIAIQILAGTPSVVYGLIGIAIIVPWIQKLSEGSGYSILAAIIILSIMILPTIVSISQDAIQSVAPELKQASLALGATRFQTILKVILPVAKPGIITAIVLAISRAFGEAMAVKMVTGNIQTMPDFSLNKWFGLLSPVRTLTTNIIMDIEYSEGAHRQALFATGAVLFIVIMIVNYFAYLFRSRLVKGKSKK